jgi:hypothetical protein
MTPKSNLPLWLFTLGGRGRGQGEEGAIANFNFDSSFGARKIRGASNFSVGLRLGKKKVLVGGRKERSLLAQPKQGRIRRL